LKTIAVCKTVQRRKNNPQNNYGLAINYKPLTRLNQWNIFCRVRRQEVVGVMKLVGLIFLLLISLTSFSHPRDSVRAAQRERARIERKSNRIAEREKAKTEKEIAKIQREREQIMRKWDQRTMEQKRNDRQALFFLAVCAGFLVHAMAHHE
jgi:hypothetical protein